MEVYNTSFSTMMNRDEFFDIPFFQRNYVWDVSNWDELLKELLEDKNSHFLGSCITKVGRLEDGKRRNLIIDGQQRITTLSILLKVCCDIGEKKGDIPAVRAQDALKRLAKIIGDNDDFVLKVRHSIFDRPRFDKIMNGDFDFAKIPTSKIEGCYKYFYDKLNEQPGKVKRVFDVLNGVSCQMIEIQLSESDDEQCIFDTINSAGVRLTSADIIKNALFQRLKTTTSERDTKRLYETYWLNIFEDDDQSVEYWNALQTKGRVSRSRIELLFQCVGVIEGIYNPEGNSLDKMADCYKKHLKDIQSDAIVTLVKKIATYAELYRNSFGKVGDGAEYDYTDDCQRLIHILHSCDISTFDPLILKMLSDSDGEITDELKGKLKKLESYVLRHIIAPRASIKNFNKECSMILKGEKTIDQYFEDKENEINDSQIEEGLRHIRTNSHGKIILFWLELERRFREARLQVKKLTYKLDLELIMPQDWLENWSTIPVINVDDGTVVNDSEEKKKIRDSAIWEIGNMTLLNSSLNRAIRNGTLSVKIEGDGRKSGVRKYNDYYCTRDVIERAMVSPGVYHWDEKTIRERTDQITKEFLRIW